MGYTHYWNTQKDGIPAPQWEAICRDVNKLLAALPRRSVNAGGYYSGPLSLAWEDDHPAKPPEVSAELIRFNGTGPKGSDLGHETFYFERHPKPRAGLDVDDTVFACCKTARKPYDLAVCGVLTVIARYAGWLVRISSDGGRGEWLPAHGWVRGVLGEGYPVPDGVGR